MEEKPIISKSRSKKTRSREKKVGKATAQKKSWVDSPWVGALLAGILWLVSVGLLDVGRLIMTPQQWSSVPYFLGKGSFLLVGLLVCVLFLGLVRPERLRQNSSILLLAAISLASLLPAKLTLFVAAKFGLTDPQIAGFLLPFTMAPLLATILLSGVAGVAVGMWTSLVMCVVVDGGIPLLLAGLAATVVCAVLAQRVRTRSKVIRIGLAAGLAQVTCVFGMTILDVPSAESMTVMSQATACLFSGFLGAVLALLILPAFEATSRITTDITLLELTDLSHPLLQRMALEAPGTYHHSLVVANLALAAAEAIGENTLAARVCSYFHDVGKLSKPEFFTENIGFQHNPHDGLPPSMSALIITAHVKEGVSLGMHHKLPRAVIDVIREHHGTSLLSYFHDKAKSQLEFELGKNGNSTGADKNAIEEWNFRYPGPKPSTLVSGIISLADPVEAASRSLEKTTPAHIEGLVDEIVTARILDGQLDNCALTMSQIMRIKASFVFALTSMLHGRTPYPKDENADKQSAKPADAGPAPAATPRSATHG